MTKNNMGMARMRSPAAEEAYGGPAKSKGMMKDMSSADDSMMDDGSEEETPTEDAAPNEETDSPVEEFVNGLDPEQLQQAYDLICKKMEDTDGNKEGA